MLKKTITYENFDGEQITEDFYFNFSKAELVEMQIRHEGGFAEYLQRIVDAKDRNQLVDAFKDLILNAYGRRSEDGKSFIKNEKVREEFYNSPAYSELFIELVTKSGAAEEFANTVVPKELVKSIVAELDKGGDDDDKADTRPAYIREDREPTQKELMAMTKEELQQAMQWKQSKDKPGRES